MNTKCRDRLIVLSFVFFMTAGIFSLLGCTGAAFLADTKSVTEQTSELIRSSVLIGIMTLLALSFFCAQVAGEAENHKCSS